ncbi:MAG: dTDP-4-dehydrorhamnose reductase [Nanoarchaeota archaeon]|nr:dTDP-4-dehydrorhamnose reductase [Nanoarchaeota archaeon]
MKTINVVVLGSKGMLGTDLVNELSMKKYKVFGLDLRDIDITISDDIKKMSSLKPEIIINCAAYTNVDGAENNKALCRKVNVNGVENLADYCKENDILLIHISTDYVFNGEKQSYTEDDKKDPINYYGLTKSEGEDAITKQLRKYYIIRTSWLFGKNGKNFVKTIIDLCGQKKEINVVDDQIGRPTYTKDFSKSIISLFEEKKPYGTYHITNSGKCSWFEFANEIKKQKKLKCKIIPCSSDEYKRDAKRPRFSVLENNKTDKLRNWKIALKDYLEAE